MNEDFYRGYRHGKLLIRMLFMLLVALMLFGAFWSAKHPRTVLKHGTVREISLAAQSCWDQGLRAVMHNDGSIECRD